MTHPQRCCRHSICTFTSASFEFTNYDQSYSSSALQVCAVRDMCMKGFSLSEILCTSLISVCGRESKAFYFSFLHRLLLSYTLSLAVALFHCHEDHDYCICGLSRSCLVCPLSCMHSFSDLPHHFLLIHVVSYASMTASVGLVHLSFFYVHGYFYECNPQPPL